MKSEDKDLKFVLLEIAKSDLEASGEFDDFFLALHNCAFEIIVDV